MVAVWPPLNDLLNQAMKLQPNKSMEDKMKSNFQLVQEFHETFGQEPLGPEFSKSTLMSVLSLRMKLLLEELQETEYAVKQLNNDTDYETAFTDLVDGLTDMLYIIYGTFDVLGLNADTAFERVHTSNMSKLGEDGEPLVNGVNTPENNMVPFGKIMKGPNYREPYFKDMVDFLMNNLMVPASTLNEVK